MTQPRRTDSYSLEPDFEGLDSSSAWVGDESAVIPPVALEPYDWTLDDETKPFTQLIPIPPPVRDGSARLRRPKSKADPSETSVLIPVEKAATGQIVKKNGAQPAAAPPVDATQDAPTAPPVHAAQISPTAPPVLATQVSTIRTSRITSALTQPKRLGSSVLLLLLSVIAVFVFAYIAQK